jgi:hypothetical protein
MAAKDFDMSASFADIYKSQIVPFLRVSVFTTVTKCQIAKMH